MYNECLLFWPLEQVVALGGDFQLSQLQHIKDLFSSSVPPAK